MTPKDVLSWLGVIGLLGTISSVVALQFFPYIEFTLKPIDIAFDNYRTDDLHVYFKELADAPQNPDGSYPQRVSPGAGELRLQIMDRIGLVRGVLSYTLTDNAGNVALQTWNIRGYQAEEYLSLSYFNAITRIGLGSYQMKKMVPRSGVGYAYVGYTTSRETNAPNKFIVCPAVFMLDAKR